MYIDDKKKMKKKIIRDFDTNNQNIQPENRNLLGEEKYEYLAILEAERIKQTEMKDKKKKKRVPQKNEKASQN